MPHPTEEFVIFAQNDKGPLRRAAAPDLEEAKRLAQQLADEEGIEFFVFSFRTAREIARFVPNPKQLRPEGGSSGE